MKNNKHNLVTINSYAKKRGVTTAAVYKWIREKKIKPVLIDGIKFIDITNQ